MRRREFIAGLGSTAAAWPLAARAQQPKMPLVGLLNGASFEGPYAAPVAAIRQGLRETGFVEGQNLAIEYRQRLPQLATDLFRRQVAVIVAIGASTPALAATAATSAVPIVFATGSDAIQVGLVDSLTRPEANLTGASFATTELASKRLELLLELRSGARLIGYLDNSRSSGVFETNVESLTTAASIKGRELVVFDAATEEEVETAFTKHGAAPRSCACRQSRCFPEHSAGADRCAGGAVYATRGAVVLGGLMSYGFSTGQHRPRRRSCFRRGASWSSTTGPPRRFASRYRGSCSVVPTR